MLLAKEKRLALVFYNSTPLIEMSIGKGEIILNIAALYCRARGNNELDFKKVCSEIYSTRCHLENNNGKDW